MQLLHVDDHPLYREAVTFLVRSCYPDATIIGAGTIEEALGAVTYYNDLSLILLDMGLPNSNGLSFLPTLMERAPGIPIAIMSGTEDRATVHHALSLGAVGYLPKSMGGQEMKEALRLILNGNVFLPPYLLAGFKLPTTSPKPRRPTSNRALSPRQTEVLRLIGDGLPNKSIARTLNVSEGTVKLHVSAILKAMGASSRTDAAMRASRRGLLTTSH